MYARTAIRLCQSMGKPESKEYLRCVHAAAGGPHEDPHETARLRAVDIRK